MAADKPAVSITVAVSELDLAAAAGLEAQIEAASLTRPRQITLDLCHVEFMDCVAVAAIGAAHRRLSQRGIRLALRSLGPQPKWLVGFARLDVPVEATRSR